MKNGGTIISKNEVIYLYDENDNEIGMTVGGSQAVAYAFAHSKRAVKAVAHNPLFGEEITLKCDIKNEQLAEVQERHELGEYLLFWVGQPVVINK